MKTQTPLAPANIPDYRGMIRSELEARTKKNARYSLRAFARDLGMTPQILSLVLNGKKGVSVETAASIAEKLGWGPDRALHFCDLVLGGQTRSALVQRMIEHRIRAREGGDDKFRVLQEDAFKSMADWYHLAILDLTETKGFEPSPQWIARRLGITLIEAKEGIQRLIRLGTLEETPNKGLRKAQVSTTTTVDVPSQAIRSFHRQMLGKAIDSIEEQSVAERDLSAVVMAIDPARLPEAKRKIEAFRRSMAELLEQGTGRSEVYAMGVQFFRLTTRPSGTVAGRKTPDSSKKNSVKEISQ